MNNLLRKYLIDFLKDLQGMYILTFTHEIKYPVQQLMYNFHIKTNDTNVDILLKKILKGLKEIQKDYYIDSAIYDKNKKTIQIQLSKNIDWLKKIV